ncbi:MAG: hypothetical protein DRI44_00025 [Chlamydiae bacterium]|nr:MAG: hypothetical protein DRI44_00025 [Chlamydiota bacterium]
MKQDYDDIREFLKGSMPAFHRIYCRYERQLFFYVNSMIRHKETSEDIFQEIWTQVIKKLPKFAFKGSFKNWLYTIAHHKVIDYTRKTVGKFNVSIDETIDENKKITYHDILSDPAPDIVEQLSTKEMIDKIRKVAENLPEKQKEVFLLRCDAGLKFKEIAEMTGDSLNTILGRMHYAIKKIRNELMDEY